jgi:hypothetical protein
MQEGTCRIRIHVGAGHVEEQDTEGSRIQGGARYWKGRIQGGTRYREGQHTGGGQDTGRGKIQGGAGYNEKGREQDTLSSRIQAGKGYGRKQKTGMSIIQKGATATRHQQEVDRSKRQITLGCKQKQNGHETLTSG